MRNEKLTDSEIAELRQARLERDRWKWLWNMLRRVALWTAALVARVIVRDNPSPLTYPAAASLSPTKKLVAYTDSAAVYGVVFDVA